MAKKDAIVLMNMGGPNSIYEVETFLKNMFNDPHILGMNKYLRRFVAGMITLFRAESAQQVYMYLGGKSPIIEHTNKLVKALQKSIGDDVFVISQMRYTPPFSKDVIKILRDECIKRVILVPLYPQYSSTTTASSIEEFIDTAKEMEYKKPLVQIIRFYQNKTYNNAIIQQIVKKMKKKNTEEYELIFSAHGLPVSVIKQGDPYQMEIEDNVSILKEMLEELNIKFSNIHLAYQSKVGPMAWLSPSLGDTLKKMEDKKVVIYPIAFVIDNSETDYELAVEYKHIAREIGIKDYKVCKVLNKKPMFVEALKEEIMAIQAKS
jgi:ferrochelatase